MSKTTIPTGGITADAIDATLIADDAISDEHLDATAITGHTALAEAPADTDEFLISDGGVLKRLDASHIGGGTHVQTGRTVLSSNASAIDVNSCFSSTYDTYLIIADKLECTVDSQSLFVRLRNDSGSVTSSNYKYANRYFEDDSNTENQNANSADNKYDITNASDDSSNSGFYHAHMYVHRPADANTQTRMIVQSSFFSDDESDMKVGIGACGFTNPEAHNGISFNISTGDIRSGASITVYGIAYT